MRVRVKVTAASSYRECAYVDLDVTDERLEDIKRLALERANTLPNDAWKPFLLLEDRGYEGIESIEFGPFEPNPSNENWENGLV